MKYIDLNCFAYKSQNIEHDPLIHNTIYLYSDNRKCNSVLHCIIICTIFTIGNIYYNETYIFWTKIGIFSEV